jgi:hypothetical protein
MKVDTTQWSGEGAFTQLLLDRLQELDGIEFIRVEDAPASRSEADYNFMSNEIYVAFATRRREERTRRFGVFSAVRVSHEKVMTIAGLEERLIGIPDVGPPDYSDAGMMQFLRAERIVPPYQTRGYKLVELVRIYEVGHWPGALPNARPDLSRH